MLTNDALKREIGARIKAARLERRLSLAALATKLGLTYQQINKYESGQNHISASTLFRVAQLLDIDLAYFFADHGTGSVPAFHGAPTLVDPELASALGRIEDDDVRRQMTRLVAAIGAHSWAKGRV